MPSRRPRRGVDVASAACESLPAAAARLRAAAAGRRSCFGAPALHREQPGGLPLDEDDDEDEHRDLREHRAGDAFEQLVEHAEAEPRDDRARRAGRRRRRRRPGTSRRCSSGRGRARRCRSARARRRRGRRCRRRTRTRACRSSRCRRRRTTAMRRFCVTPRMKRPKRVLAISSATPPRTMKAKAMIAIRLNGSTRLLITLDAAREPARVLDRHVLGAEDRAHRLLQDEADAPGREQRLERPAVEEADHAALEHRADQRPRPGTRPESRRRT